MQVNTHEVKIFSFGNVYTDVGSRATCPIRPKGKPDRRAGFPLGRSGMRLRKCLQY